MAELRLEGVSRRFGHYQALSNIDLHVEEGQFVSLLGPSGCGKSTTLAIIAGLDRPTSGRVEIDGRTVADAARDLFVPPESRGLGLVLQSYALWPHMTVRQNVALPLAIRKIAKSKRDALVDEYLGLVELADFADRYPHELSGGQQQRAALARTLVYRPVVLLLDEPLSNVDAKLRERARTWLRQLQRKFAITTIFVTHDQAEALSMSDRIAVMSEGRIVQCGSPAAVYANPNSPFVADFVGSSNFLNGRVGRREADGASEVVIEGQSIRVPIGSDIAAGTCVVVSIRPERIGPGRGDAAPGANLLRARISHADFLGSRCLYHADIGGQALRFEWPHSSLRDEVILQFSSEDCFVFTRDASEAESRLRGGQENRARTPLPGRCGASVPSVQR